MNRFLLACNFATRRKRFRKNQNDSRWLRAVAKSHSLSKNAPVVARARASSRRTSRPRAGSRATDREIRSHMGSREPRPITPTPTPHPMGPPAGALPWLCPGKAGGGFLRQPLRRAVLEKLATRPGRTTIRLCRSARSRRHAAPRLSLASPTSTRRPNCHAVSRAHTALPREALPSEASAPPNCQAAQRITGQSRTNHKP